MIKLEDLGQAELALLKELRRTSSPPMWDERLVQSYSLAEWLGIYRACRDIKDKPVIMVDFVSNLRSFLLRWHVPLEDLDV